MSFICSQALAAAFSAECYSATAASVQSKSTHIANLWRADGEPDDQVRRDAVLYDVPCNGCTLCCHNDAVRILPHEDATKWRTEPHDYMPGARMLAHKPNGDCVYLDEHGCTIQHDKPQQCREMDCRRIARAISWTQARKMDADGRLRMSIWRRGKDLAKAVEAR